MENNNAEKLIAQNKPAVLSLFVWLLLLIGSTIIAFQVGDFFLKRMAGISSYDILKLTQESQIDLNTKYAILLFQGISSFFSFIFSSIVFFTLYNKIQVNDLLGKRYNQLYPYLLGGGILFCFFIVNTFFIEINAKMDLPSFLDDLESQLRGMEDELAEFTKVLTQFDNFPYFLATIFVIAVLPAVGEELLFRGILQNIVHKLSGNYHIAIWIAAILFSSIHMQFFGFLPRMLLGVLFGYLYVWSGNLLVPILAHFLNNSISLFLLYSVQQNITDMDVESEESFPIAIILAFAALATYLLYLFYTYYKKAGTDGQLE